MSANSAQKPENTALPASKGLWTLAALWPFIRPYKGTAALALLALMFTAGLTLSLGQGVRLLIDQGFISGSIAALNQTVGLLAVIITLMAAGTFARFYWMTWLGERVTADLRQAVFDHLITLHPSYFEENRSGEVMSRLTTDTTLLQSIIGSSFSLALRSLLMLLGGLIMLLITNLKLSLVVLAAVPLVLIPILIFGKRVRRLSRASQDRIANVGTYAGEIIQQIKTVQSYHREPDESHAFGREVEAAFQVARQRILQRAWLMSLVILLAFSAIGGMLWIGGVDVIEGRLSGGELAAFVFYAVIVASGVATVSEVLGELQRAAGAAERLIELLQVDSEIKAPEASPENTPAVSGRTATGSTDPHTFHLQLDQVSFAYPSRPDQPALKGFSASIRHGETVALVGPSGAGKSTLFELLLRFYDPQSGRILYQGQDLRAMAPGDFRAHIAWVPQQPTLFSRDVNYNIRYGRPDATSDEVLAAAQAASADEFIRQLPQGYDSFLGENGVRLSGGQKQRLIIARAILRDPALLLLDEATSALDTENEYRVQQALINLTRGRTTLIIAHRLSTIRHADRILLLDQGQCIAEGSHEALMRDNTTYQRLVRLQFGRAGKEVGKADSASASEIQ